MDLRQLEFFTAVADLRSFSKAAAAAFVAQPAMSQQIAKLERELGVSLLDRSNRPVRLTPAGEHLHARAKAILDAVERASVEVQAFSGEFRGRIVIGSMQYLASAELADIIADYGAVHPAVQVRLRIANTGQLLEMLRAGDIDIAYCHSEGPSAGEDLEVTRLRSEELVIVLSREDPAAARPSIALDELLDRPFIAFQAGASTHGALLRLFATVGREPQVLFESADLATAFALVKRGLGVAMVPRCVAERDPSVVGLSLAPAPVALTVAQIWRPDRSRSLALTAFADQARTTLMSSRFAPDRRVPLSPRETPPATMTAHPTEPSTESSTARGA